MSWLGATNSAWRACPREKDHCFGSGPRELALAAASRLGVGGQSCLFDIADSRCRSPSHFSSYMAPMTVATGNGNKCSLRVRRNRDTIAAAAPANSKRRYHSGIGLSTRSRTRASTRVSAAPVSVHNMYFTTQCLHVFFVASFAHAAS